MLQAVALAFGRLMKKAFSSWRPIRKSETKAIQLEGRAFVGQDPAACGRKEVKVLVKVRGGVEERFVRWSARISSNLLLTQS